jgi:hypothetical protein
LSLLAEASQDPSAATTNAVTPLVWPVRRTTNGPAPRHRPHESMGR